MKIKWKSACYIVGTLFSLSMLFLAVAWGWADINTWPVKRALVDWGKAGHITNEGMWTKISRYANVSRRFNLVKADYNFQLAKLYEWRAYQQRLSPKLHKTNRQIAGSFYVSSLELRPTWGSAWADLARNNLANVSTKDSGYLALEKALVYAPWEYGVLKNVATLGIINWHGMGDELKTELRKAIKKLLNNAADKNYFLNLAKQYQWTKELELIQAGQG
ncbi:hypothetical protein ACFL17_02135 [Pseudomonadota bacterium]